MYKIPYVFYMHEQLRVATKFSCQMELFYFTQRWYVDGTVECFTGGHAALAVFAITILGLCAALIVIMVAITMGKVKV